MVEAGTQICPACGSPSGAFAASCTSCGVRLGSSRCARCFGPVYADSTECPQCGAPVAPADVTSADTRSCPRCTVPLDATALGDAYLDECPQCSGVWVDIASFERIGTNPQEQTAIVTLGAPQHHPDVTQVGSVRYIPCPTCRRLMNRVNFAHCSGVIVDLCKSHGVWFDADELRRVVEFIRHGGLAQAQAHELEVRSEARRAFVPQPVALEGTAAELVYRQRAAMHTGMSLLNWITTQ